MSRLSITDENVVEMRYPRSDFEKEKKKQTTTKTKALGAVWTYTTQ